MKPSDVFTQTERTNSHEYQKTQKRRTKRRNGKKSGDCNNILRTLDDAEGLMVQELDHVDIKNRASTPPRASGPRAKRSGELPLAKGNSPQPLRPGYGVISLFSVNSPKGTGLARDS